MAEECKGTQLTQGEFGLTKKLLTTLGRISERQYVGGRYLVPLSLRYDNQDVSMYTTDKTCIFFSFPYLCLDPHGRPLYYKKEDNKHPPRTLLQSHYRLNRTDDRDASQCIRWLKSSRVNDCIIFHPDESDDISKLNPSTRPRRKPEPLFLVPQLWGVIVGLGTSAIQKPVKANNHRHSCHLRDHKE